MKIVIANPMAKPPQTLMFVLPLSAGIVVVFIVTVDRKDAFLFTELSIKFYKGHAVIPIIVKNAV